MSAPDFFQIVIAYLLYRSHYNIMRSILLPLQIIEKSNRDYFNRIDCDVFNKADCDYYLNIESILEIVSTDGILFS